MLTEFYNFIDHTLDGAYGLVNETVALIIYVVVFNVGIRWILNRLNARFEKQKKYWQSNFIQALSTPLAYYIWFSASIHFGNIIFQNFKHTCDPFNKMHVALSIGAVLAIAWFFMRWKRNTINQIVTKNKTHSILFDRGKIDALDKLASVSIFFLTVIELMNITGRSMNTLIAFGGIGGLALAIASQEIIGNFFGGLMIYLTHPFSVGDWINLPERGLEGHVEDIGWYMTRIRTFEKRPIYVPNSTFSKTVVMTPSRMSHRQFKETFRVRYSDIKVIKEIVSGISEMLREHPNIDQDQKTLVYLDSFEANSLNILVSTYTLATQSEAFAYLKQDLLLEIIEILHKHGADLSSRTTTIDIPNGVLIHQSTQ